MKINQLKAGAALSYLSMGLGFLVSIIFTPVMLRLLGQNEYGLYNLVASVVSYLGVLNFGFGSAYIRFYSKYKAKKDYASIATLNGMFLIIYSVIGLIAVCAGLFLALNSSIVFGSELTNQELDKSRMMMIILMINLAVSFPNIVFSSYITANERFVFQKLLQLIKLIVDPLIILPVLLMGYGSVGMVIITTAVNILVELINVLFCLRKLNMKFSFKNFDFKLMKEMTVFSSFIFINMLTDQVNWNVDKILLGRFHGTISVAVYGLAAQLNSYYRMIGNTISALFVPRVHKLVAGLNNDLELSKLFTKIGRVQFMILSMMGSGMIFFGRPFIHKWAGSNYDGSYPILLWLAIPITIDLIQNIGIEITRAKNMHKFRSLVYFFIAIGNIAISIPLSKLYGGVGAAIGTAISVLIGNGLIMNWYYGRKVQLDIKKFWRQILNFAPAFILPVGFGVLINSWFDLYQKKTLISAGILYMIIFVVSMWLFGMNQFEKDLLGTPIKRMAKRIH